MDKAQELYTMQKYFGTHELNLILGNLESYKVLRYEHSFQEIFDEVNKIMNNN